MIGFVLTAVFGREGNWAIKFSLSEKFFSRELFQAVVFFLIALKRSL